MSLFSRIKNIVLDILFPPLCAVCGGHAETYLCAPCSFAIHKNTALYCSVCYARIPDPDLPCHPKALFLLGAVGAYDDPMLQKAIHSFKYEKVKVLAQPLSALLIDYINTLIRNSDLDIRNFTIVPVPLHPRRLRDRGFNQSKLLGENISAFFALPSSDALVRARNNKAQVEIEGRAARYKNIEGVFAIPAREEVAGKNILLLDDVFTSGATMTEAARVLKSAGAKKIIALVLARA